MCSNGTVHHLLLYQFEPSAADVKTSGRDSVLKSPHIATQSTVVNVARARHVHERIQWGAGVNALLSTTASAVDDGTPPMPSS